MATLDSITSLPLRLARARWYHEHASRTYYGHVRWLFVCIAISQVFEQRCHLLTTAHRRHGDVDLTGKFDEAGAEIPFWLYRPGTKGLQKSWVHQRQDWDRKAGIQTVLEKDHEVGFPTPPQACVRGIVTSTVVLRFSECMSNRPPHSFTRSRMPESPTPVCAPELRKFSNSSDGMPRPQSRICKATLTSSKITCISALGLWE
jgi:hypothetical protein